jgi:hypothetical protein
MLSGYRLSWGGTQFRLDYRVTFPVWIRFEFSLRAVSPPECLGPLDASELVLGLLGVGVVCLVCTMAAFDAWVPWCSLYSNGSLGMHPVLLGKCAL